MSRGRVHVPHITAQLTLIQCFVVIAVWQKNYGGLRHEAAAVYREM